MCKRLCSIFTILAIVFVWTGILSSCEKEGSVAATSAAVGTSTVTAAKTTAKASQSKATATAATKTGAGSGSGSIIETTGPAAASEDPGDTSSNEPAEEAAGTEDVVVSEEKPVDLGGITLKYN
ncbi:MAG: hypothetical protein PHG48_03200, partial [Eubacteriales bacterium]|nr:hypothetical protein [Eubacteriales bacterium]